MHSFQDLTDGAAILAEVDKTIRISCRKEDHSQILPVIDSVCAYNVIMKGLQRLTQLNPPIAGKIGLLSERDAKLKEYDHETNVLFSLSTKCHSSQSPAERIGDYVLTGKAACAHRILKQFVVEIQRQRIASNVPSKLVSNFENYNGDDNGEAGSQHKMVLSVGAILAISLTVALVYNAWPQLLKQPWFWLVLSLVAIGSLAITWPNANGSDNNGSGGTETPLNSNNATVQQILSEPYYREHTDPMRSKGMTSVMFELTPQQKFGQNFKAPARKSRMSTKQSGQSRQPPNEMYFRERADRIHAKTMHNMWNFQG